MTTSPPNNVQATGAAIGMSNAAASARIEEDYAASLPYQHSLEIPRNAAQAPATTHVRITIIQIPGTGALKRAFINNGAALTAEQLNRYMTTIGEGDGDIWRLDNTLGHRHAGARTAVLPFTDLQVVSWDRDTLPAGLQMTLYKNLATTEYEYSPITSADPAVLKELLTDRAEVQATGHGVAFVYLGRDHAADGPFVDPNPAKGETDNGIADALRDRIYAPLRDDGQHITITVDTPMPHRKNSGTGGKKLTGASGTQYRLDGRTTRGHRAWTSRTSESGTVLVDPDMGVEIRWTLLPFDLDPTDRRLPFGGKGHVIARYKNESMVLAAPGGDYPDLPPKMRLFGVQLADVYNRLVLEIEGPTDPGSDPANPRLHLHQDPSRSRLVLSNGAELLLARWGEAFIEQMPKAIAEANKAARERVSRAGTVKLSTGDRLKARLKSRLNSAVQSRRRKSGTGILGPSGSPGTDYLDGMVNTDETLPTGAASSDGDDGLTTGGSNRQSKHSKHKGAKRRSTVTATGTSTTRRRRPGSEGATEVQPRPAPVPEPVPLTSADWAAQGLDPDHFASWDPASGCVYFNQGHPIMCTQFAFFTGEWLDVNARYRRRVQAEDVRTALLEAYAEDTIGRIMHYVADQGLQLAKEHLTDQVLTIGAHGFENVQAKVEEYVRTAGGRGVVSTGVAA